MGTRVRFLVTAFFYSVISRLERLIGITRYKSDSSIRMKFVHLACVLIESLARTILIIQ